MNIDKTLIDNIYPEIHHVVHRYTEKGWKIDTRTIEDHEIVLIEKGKGSITVEGVKYTVVPGMLLYFYPSLRHSLETDDNDPFSFLAVHFGFVFLKNTNGSWNVDSTPAKLPFEPVQNIFNHRALMDNMLKLIDIFSRHLPGWELMTRSLFQACVYYIYHYTNLNNLDYSAKIKVDTVARYITGNAEKRITAGELSEIVHVTPDYISRIFKKHTGYSLIKYIHKCKIEASKVYLLEQNLNLNEIALKLGFSDEFHFSKVFKKVEGVSPSKFIQKD